MSLKSETSDTSADTRPARSLDGVPTLLRWALAAILALTICVVGALFGRQVLSALPWLKDLPRVAAIPIFAATYLFIAIGKLPGYQLDRAGAALLGASSDGRVRRRLASTKRTARSISTRSRSCSA